MHGKILQRRVISFYKCIHVKNVGVGYVGTWQPAVFACFAGTRDEPLVGNRWQCCRAGTSPADPRAPFGATAVGSYRDRTAGIGVGSAQLGTYSVIRRAAAYQRSDAISASFSVTS
jgi:hypothetical protein